MGFCIRGMLWTSLRVRTRQKVRTIPTENLADRLRIEHVTVEWIVFNVPKRQVNQAAILLRAQGAMHEPLLVEHGSERKDRDLVQQSEDMLISKRS